MCFCLYVGSNQPPALARYEERPGHVNGYPVEADHPQAAEIRQHFTLPEVASLGAAEGCGCGFLHRTMDQNWLTEESIRENWMPSETDRQNRRELYELVASQVAEFGLVELYGCWNDDEGEATEREEEITLEQVLDVYFWFRHRVLYRVREANQE
ncbi:MAG: hypothetical protein ABSF26_25515 [Thermoguttaceae bacterium]